MLRRDNGGSRRPRGLFGRGNRPGCDKYMTKELKSETPDADFERY